MSGVTKSGRVSPTAVRRALEATAGITILGRGSSIGETYRLRVSWDGHRGWLDEALDAIHRLGLTVEVVAQYRNSAALRIAHPLR